MRRLASIQRVINVRPIEGADKIEAVDVLGWTVVCKKDEFKVGDLCVYFEIDSFLSAEDKRYASFSDRFTNWGTKRGMRIKTIKLRKQLSQGLVMPVTGFFELCNSGFPTVKEGDDVTDILKIEKWEPAEEASSNAGGNISKVAGAKPFPSFLRKTDQERVQNYIGELHKHADETFEVTIKLDGSSMTVYHVGPTSPHFAHACEDIEIRAMRKMSWLQKKVYAVKKFFGRVNKPEYIADVCSRNIQLGIDEGNHFSTYVREHKLIEKLAKIGLNVAVQGELIGTNIQGNYERVSNYEFHVYSVFDIDMQEHYRPEMARTLVECLGMKHVPVLETEYKLPAGEPREVVDKLLDYAIGDGMNKGVRREGLVAKSNQTGFSFKIISNEYLIYKEKKLK